MPPITPRLHGVLDYATAAVSAGAPRLFGFPAPAARAARALAASYVGYSLFTAYPLGAVKAISFRSHGALDLLFGVAAPALPWALGFAGHAAARNFFLALAGITAVVLPLTDWRGVERDTARHTSMTDTSTTARRLGDE